MAKIFIDGQAGTTGLRIYDRLAGRADIELLLLPDERRKDPVARAEQMNRADVVFLCLPDAAAVDAVPLVTNPYTAVIDTSTAHRTDPAWEYGFAELHGRRERLRTARRIANPGCHASGFVALVEPLVRNGLLAPDTALTCFSLTGYSGGGKAMIAEYASDDRDPLLDAPRQYGLTQQHKHLKEMTQICGLYLPPAFCPIVAPYYSGMEVTVPLFVHQVNGTREEIQACYRTYYREGLVHYVDAADEYGFLSAAALAGRDDMQITVGGNDERLLLTARFDNLGKGASGSAIQLMNLLLGVAENTGLVTD